MLGGDISFFVGGSSEEIDFLTLISGTECCLSRKTSVFLQTACDLAQYSQTLQNQGFFHWANSTLEILLTIYSSDSFAYFMFEMAKSKSELKLKRHSYSFTSTVFLEVFILLQLFLRRILKRYFFWLLDIYNGHALWIKTLLVSSVILEITF